MVAGKWKHHIGKSDSHFVNWLTRGIRLSQKILSEAGWKRNLTQGVISKVIHQAVKKIADQFIVGQNIQQALEASQLNLKKGYSYSYDMLGEVARTQQDADYYFQKYQLAIKELNEQFPRYFNEAQSVPGISVKLSALYPRYQWTHRQQAIPILRQNYWI